MSARNEKLLFRPNPSGRLHVCLAYPNTYAVGMANLGFQAVYRLFATLDDTRCERAFLPDDESERLATFESGRSLAECHVLAFSLSFESDYPNIVRMLDAAGIPARASEPLFWSRGRRWSPMLLCRELGASRTLRRRCRKASRWSMRRGRGERRPLLRRPQTRASRCTT